MTWTPSSKTISTFTAYAKRILSFLQKEDSTYLLLEDGTSKIVIDYGAQVSWVPTTKS